MWYYQFCKLLRVVGVVVGVGVACLLKKAKAKNSRSVQINIGCPHHCLRFVLLSFIKEMIANDTTKSSGGLELNHTKKLTQNIEGVTGQEGRINDTVEEARHILQIRLVSFMKHYEQINDKLEKYCTRLESYSLNGLYQDKRLNQPYSMTIQSYRVKLQSIRVFILRINDKLSRLQCRYCLYNTLSYYLDSQIFNIHFVYIFPN